MVLSMLLAANEVPNTCRIEELGFPHPRKR